MQGKIYIENIKTGEKAEVVGITEADITAADDIDSPVIFPREPIEITVEAKIDKLTLLSILTGVKVTNNWLKLHGGIMRRKRWISNG